ncbi:type II CRISPR RNA-guided endonuclease Cas9 [uncultured Dubosiella sp.]|uniref:type II CRISPR RNA-guided endonuclease Cas9 n=3 Tax=uncultured Dubosiella sp. TaxID=1937011 RepID=UPI0025B39C36|nr:type II CRISPR RNA-guided endonuclease Cas9 [uncultured Dubosiella sp.]
MDQESKYYIGLDMGTSSVGWAVTDANYELVRKKGKDMWGVRLFEEATTAQDRRTNRISRRRNQRKKQRIAFVKEKFRDEVEKVDSNFFRRLNESQLYLEDKTVKAPYLLFNDFNYTDQDFYRQYPTVFHLITDILTSDRKFDIRAIYIAVSSLFAHRGNFLNKSLGNESQEDDQVFEKMIEVSKRCEMNWNFDSQNLEEVKSILCARNLNKTKKQDELIRCLKINKKTEKDKIEFLKLLTGGNGDPRKMFPQYDYESDAKLSFSFSDENWEEKLVEIEDKLTTDEYEWIWTLKSVYDWSILSNLMKNEKTGTTYPYLSMARKDSYEKHKADLKLLKSVIKRLLPKEYNRFFREFDENGKTYTNYIGSVQYHGKKQRFKHVTQEEFYGEVKKLLKPFYKTDKEVDEIYSEIELGTFMPKQITNTNGVIPNQVHAKELDVILEKASRYYDFLNETDKNGLAVKEQIMQMFTFQIPYYVGPLANYNGQGNGWAVRFSGQEGTKIYPWNMTEVIDEKETANQFIKRMIKTCTYLGDEYVLPKNSILYEKFAVLNELNPLKINGEPISVELKQNIYHDLFLKGKRVTKKGLIAYLKRQGVIAKEGETILSGFDQDFKNTLSSYRKFCDVFESNTLTDQEIQIAEDIIEWLTVFGDSKKFVKEKIQEKYPQITSKQMKRILSFNFKDWGQLSKEFLELEGEDLEIGEYRSLIQALWETNCNLNQLLSSQFTYRDSLEKKRKKIEKDLFEFTHDDLEGLYLSAPVKRMVWQALKIMKDIVKVMKEPPAKLFIEMTRSDGEKVRTISRKKALMDLYRKIKGESRNWVEELNNRQEKDFRSKKLYLYYTQMGKCAYSGESIDMSRLFDQNIYDIEHIYPRCKVKDDSLLNNLLLVKRDENKKKGDHFPIRPEVQNKMENVWNFWFEHGLITQEKYNRLTRKKTFTDEELGNFVNRQLVETGQATKSIADLFKQTFSNSDIVYVKAGNVSDFRKYIKVYKCREVNNFHHAYDAYLNVVVGNVYDTKFTKNPINYIKEQKSGVSNEKYHMDKIFNYPVSRNGEDAWITKDGKSVKVVKRTLLRKTPLVTKRNYEFFGTIADATVYPKGKIKEQGYLPRKTSVAALRDMKKYGGVTSLKIAYFFLVEHKVKNKKIRTIECVPVYLREKLKTREQLETYCVKELGLVEPSVRLDKIKKYSLLKLNGNFFYITGKTNKQLSLTNAMELCVDRDSENHIRDLTKYKNMGYCPVDEEEFRKRDQLLYENLMAKHLNVFNRRPNSMGQKLQQYQPAFIKLEIPKQVEILLQILRLTSTNEITMADLKDIGGGPNVGKILISKNITTFKDNQPQNEKKSNFTLINQSPTGLFESELDLLTI